MTNFKFARIAALFAAAACGSSAFAAGSDTANLTVGASVQSLCKLITVPPMNFNLDPSSGAAGTASSVVEYKCTKNATAPTVTLGASGGAAGPYGGTLTGATTASETMTYAINWTNPSAAGAGFAAAVQTVTLSGTIANAQYVDKSAQSFTSPSVTVNLNF